LSFPLNSPWPPYPLFFVFTLMGPFVFLFFLFLPFPSCVCVVQPCRSQPPRVDHRPLCASTPFGRFSLLLAPRNLRALRPVMPPPPPPATPQVTTSTLRPRHFGVVGVKDTNFGHYFRQGTPTAGPFRCRSPPSTQLPPPVFFVWVFLLLTIFSFFPLCRSYGKPADFLVWRDHFIFFTVSVPFRSSFSCLRRLVLTLPDVMVGTTLTR